MDETARRRQKQSDFNIEHHITPKSVKKEIRDIIDGVYKEDVIEAEKEVLTSGAEHDPKQMAREIKQLEKEMFECAKNLEFEKAAKIRDRLVQLKEIVFGAQVKDKAGVVSTNAS
jgi:excinuclease ABC subunit B